MPNVRFLRTDCPVRHFGKGHNFWRTAYLLAIAAGFSAPFLVLPNLSAFDLNGDGMSDVWQRTYSVPAEDAQADYNGVGLSNIQKSMLGLDPRSGSAAFTMSIAPDSEEQLLRLSFDAQFGKLYQLESSNDLQNWTIFGDLVHGVGVPASILVDGATPSLVLFRSRFAGDIDNDGDGLNAWEEQQLGTSDNNVDSDFDGVSDSQEIAQGTDPADFYNGQVASIAIIAGNDQQGDPETFLPEPLTVNVLNPGGQPVANAPVVFTIASGGGAFAAVPTAQRLMRNYSAGRRIPTEALAVSASDAVTWSYTAQTDSSGNAQVGFLLPWSATTVSQIEAKAGVRSNAPGVTFTASTNSVQQPPNAPSDVLASPDDQNGTVITWQDNSNNEDGFNIEKQDSNGAWTYARWADADMTAARVGGQAQNYRINAELNGSVSESVESNPVTRRYAVLDLQHDLTLPYYLDPLYLTNSGYLLLRDGRYNYRWHNGAIQDMGEFNSFMDMLEDGTLIPEAEGDEHGRIEVWKIRNGVSIGGGYISFGTGQFMNKINGRQVPFTIFDLNNQGLVLGYDNQSFFFYDELGGGTKTPFLPAPGSDPWPFTLNHRKIAKPDFDGNPEMTVSPQVVGANYSIEKAVIWEENPRTGKYSVRYLNQLLPPNVDWNLQYAEGINDSGVIACIGNLHPGTSGAQQKACLLVPADLAVDANNDGVIKFGGNADDESTNDKPADHTTEAKPFRFWLNNDDDEPNGTERVPVRLPDNLNGSIDGTRDLEDFTRLHLYLGGLHDAFVKGDIGLGLEWKNVTGSPAIWLYRSADPDGSEDYLSNQTAATEQVTPPFGSAVGRVDNNAPLILHPSVFENLSSDKPVAHFLFEAAGEGKGQLVISFWRGGEKIGEGPGVWIDLKDIKKMYERIDSAFGHPWQYVPFEPDPNEDRNNTIVFVHGWRMSPEGAGNFAETFYKRLWHRGFKGRYAAFHWDTWWSDSFQWLPNIGGPLDAYLSHYNESEHAAWQAAAPLRAFVNSISSPNKNIVAHSMGNIVASEALRLGMQIDNYALLQAAVPAACYDDDEGRIRQTLQYNHDIFTMWDNDTPDDDADPNTRALAYRGRFKGVTGNLTNFFLPDDYATFKPWEVNNDQTKPPGGLFRANFEYERTGLSGHKLFKYMGGRRGAPPYALDHYLADPYEAMPFACRTWGKAAGAWGNTAGVLTATVNLNSDTYHLPGQEHGFGDQHSGEFDATIQHLTQFYSTILDSFAIGRKR